MANVEFNAPKFKIPVISGIELTVEFEPLPQYDGEYGFDWLKCDEKNEILKIQTNNISDLEFVFDESKMEYILISADVKLKDKIKEEYKNEQMLIPNYYLPWLTLSQKQGEIKLNMISLPLNNSDISKSVISFQKNDFYEISIDGKTNENIKYTPDGKPKEISIKCLKPSDEIDITAIDEKNRVVGKLRAINNLKSYKLPIRLVCLVKNSSTKDVEIAQMITDFKTLNVVDYLNKNSLNQALIETDVEIDAKYEISFDEDAWNGTFYDKTNNYFTNRKVSGGKVTYINDEGETIENANYEHVLDKFLRDYKSIFETDGKKFKGILLFITNINKDPLDKEGGVSRTQPVNFREAIVFKSNLNDKSTYAHELAHALGLEHYFWREAEYKEGLDTCKNSVRINEQAIINNNNNIKTSENNIKICNSNIKIYQDRIKDYENYNKSHPNYYKENPSIDKYVKEQKESIRKEKQDLKKSQDNIKENQEINKKIEKRIVNLKKNIGVYKDNKFKFKEKSTLNIMDYSSKTNIFSKWQCKLMQNDVNSYYGTVIENK